MTRMKLAVVFALSLCASAAAQYTVSQLNANLDPTPGDQWTYDSLAKTIQIIQGNAAEAYIFRATYGTDPENDPLDEIARIETELQSGMIRLRISGTDSLCEVPGATAVKKIAIDPPGVESIIECINITGDFLETEAMTVDQVTGRMKFGDPADGTPAGLLNGITINGDLNGRLVVNGETNGAIDIYGNVNKRMILMGHVNAPITVDGDLASDGISDGEIYIGYWRDYQDVPRVLNADLKADMTIKGNVNAPIWIYGEIAQGVTLKVEGSVFVDQPPFELGIHVTEGNYYYDDPAYPDPDFPEYDELDPTTWKGLWGTIEVGESPEPFVDDNPPNGTWDEGEAYTDVNGNGQWDEHVGMGTTTALGRVSIVRDIHAGNPPGAVHVYGDVVNRDSSIHVSWRNNGIIHVHGNCEGHIRYSQSFGKAPPKPPNYDNSGSLIIDDTLYGLLLLYGELASDARVTVNANEQNVVAMGLDSHIGTGPYLFSLNGPHGDVHGVIDIRGDVACGSPAGGQWARGVLIRGKMDGLFQIEGDVQNDSEIALNACAGTLQIGGDVENGSFLAAGMDLRQGAYWAGQYADVQSNPNVLIDTSVNFEELGVIPYQTVEIKYGSDDVDTG